MMYNTVRNILIAFCLFTMVGCTFVGKAGQDGLTDTDCLPERKSEDTLSTQIGTIIEVAEQFVILSQDGNSRFLACNLPDTYKKSGIKVTYSLIVKEIYPNERLIATPAFLTEISSKP